MNFSDNLNLTNLTFNDKKITLILDENIAWFKFDDIRKILKYTDNIKQYVNDDFVKIFEDENFINEQGLYQLIFKCKLSIAKELHDWFFEQVLPSIINQEKYARKEWIYIITTKQYAVNNVFKIGYITTINIREQDIDNYYYCYYKRVKNAKDSIDYIKMMLSKVPYKIKSDLYCFDYDSFEKTINYLINGYEKITDYIEYIKNNIDYINSLPPIIPEPIELPDDDDELDRIISMSNK